MLVGKTIMKLQDINENLNFGDQKKLIHNATIHN